MATELEKNYLLPISYIVNSKPDQYEWLVYKQINKSRVYLLTCRILWHYFVGRLGECITVHMNFFRLLNTNVYIVTWQMGLSKIISETLI